MSRAPFPEAWDKPQTCDMPTSERYRPQTMRDRLCTAICWLSFLGLVACALSGCTPMPTVTCFDGGCASSIVEVTP